MSHDPHADDDTPVLFATAAGNVRVNHSRLFSGLVRAEATEAVSKAVIHAGTIFHCTGIMVPLYTLAVYFELPFVHVNYVIEHIINQAANHPQAKFHELMSCYWNFQDSRWCDHLNIYQMHHLESLMFEIVERWESTLANITRMAEVNGQSAKWVIAAAHLNQRAIYQCYAEHMQKLADEHPPETIHPARNEDTICRTFQFNQGPLWDLPYNIEQINAAQDRYTDRDRNPRANAPVREVYGRQVPAEMQVEGELTVYWKGLPMTFTTCDYDTDEITASLKHKFCMGMPANVLP